MPRQRRILSEAAIRAAYCREMDRLEPSDDLKKRTLAALALEYEQRNGSKPVHRLVAKRRSALPFLASAAVLLLAFGAFFTLRVFLSKGPMAHSRSKRAEMTADAVMPEQENVVLYEAKLEAPDQMATEAGDEDSLRMAQAGADETKGELLAPPMAIGAAPEAANAAAQEVEEAAPEAMEAKGAERSVPEGDQSPALPPESSPYYPAAQDLALALKEAGYAHLSGFTLTTEPGTAFPVGFNLDSLHEALAEALRAMRTDENAASAEKLVSITLKSARIEGHELVFTAVLPSPAKPIDLRMPRP